MSLATIVKGNTFSLAIPLQVYAVEDGEVVLRDYTPESGDNITIRLKGDRRNYTYIPSTNGSTAFIHLEGSEVVGVYAVEVEIVKDDDSKLTSMRFDQLSIVESIDELNGGQITEGIEQGAIYLDPEIFIAGEDGRGIVSIIKTATSGLVDTYTITYTDSTTSTFNVTNGKDGINGQDGVDGADGVGIASIAKTGTQGLVDTYTITMTNGTTYTYQVTNGKDGENGRDGADGQDGTDGVGIVSITKTSTAGLVDTYTITLSNGTTATFEVTNGQDAHDLGLAVIVNNLIDGGVDDALSAEMGKEIGDALFSETYDEEVRPYFAISTSATTIYKEGFEAVFKIPVTGGTKIVWKCGHSTANEVALTEYGSDGTRKAINRNATTDKTITLNAATTYINASFKSDYADAGIYKEDGTAIWIPNSVAGIKQKVERLEEGAPYDMVEDIEVTYTDGYVIGFDGVATALTNGRISGFIQVTPGETYKVGGNQHNATPAYLVVCGYSSNDESTAIPTAFPFVLTSAACAVYNITIPTGVNYIRLSNYNRNGATLDALTSYKAFIGMRKYYKHNDALSNEVQYLKKSSGIVRDMWASDGTYTNNTTGTYGSIKCFKFSVGTSVTNRLAIIPCSAGDRFTVNTNTTIGSAVAFYDASLTRMWYSSAPYSNVVTAPASAVWLVLNLAAADTGNYVGADRLDGLSIWRGTQAQYDAMSSHDNNILYLIVE